MEQSIIEASALAGSTEGVQTTIWGLFIQATWIVKIVMLMLIGASVWSWAIIFEKIWRLRKLDATYDPSDRAGALQYMMERQAKGEVVTGLLYLDTGDTELKEKMEMTDSPLNSLGVSELRPDMAMLEKINAGLR